MSRSVLRHSRMARSRSPVPGPRPSASGGGSLPCRTKPRSTSAQPSPKLSGRPSRKYPSAVRDLKVKRQQAPSRLLLRPPAATRSPARSSAKSQARSWTAYPSSSSAAATARPSPCWKREAISPRRVGRAAVSIRPSLSQSRPRGRPRYGRRRGLCRGEYLLSVPCGVTG